MCLSRHQSTLISCTDFSTIKLLVSVTLPPALHRRHTPPSFTSAPPGCKLSAFQTLDVDSVAAVIRKLLDKQCATTTRYQHDSSRTTPTYLHHFITELCNRSLSSGVFPTLFKSAFITPLLKKPDLDAADCKSYRPISNLSVLSKTVERLVARQLIDHLNLWKLMPDLQSAYRANHSTETAVLRGLSDKTFSVHWIVATSQY